MKRIAAWIMVLMLMSALMIPVGAEETLDAKPILIAPRPTSGLLIAPNPAATERTYKVVEGDCLWSIARVQLGSGARWKEIYELNKDLIRNPELIYIGQLLKLPV